MAIKIRDRVPIYVQRSSEETGAPEQLKLAGCRFMGVLLHPVSWCEMQRRCNASHRGYRVVVEWPDKATDDHPVKVGDVLEIAGETHAVCAVTERSGCYLEIYIAES